MKDIEKIILYIVLFILIVGFIWSITRIFKSEIVFQHSEQRYQQFVQSELNDKCAVPPGYTKEVWREHMSHHPNRYKGCL
jgi:hypothetical protein